MLFTGLPAGNYVLHQSDCPSGYVVGPYVTFPVDGMTATTITVENRALSDTEILIQALVALLIAILQDILNGL